VDERTRYTTVLRQAAEVLGGADRLATFLETGSEQLERWLNGAETPPLPIFLATLDVIADGAAVRRP
jgi:hypothetical protein